MTEASLFLNGRQTSGVLQPGFPELGTKRKSKVRSRNALSSEGRVMKMIRRFLERSFTGDPSSFSVPSYSSRASGACIKHQRRAEGNRMHASVSLATFATSMAHARLGFESSTVDNIWNVYRFDGNHVWRASMASCCRCKTLYFVLSRSTDRILGVALSAGLLFPIGLREH